MTNAKRKVTPGVTRPSAATAAERLDAFLEARRRSPEGQRGQRFEEFEEQLHELMMARERELLAEDMARADVDVPAIEVNGITYRQVSRDTLEYLTAAGPVQVERSLYKDRSDEGERAIVPMELELGIMAGYFTPRAAKQGLWLVSQMTPTTAAECCERMGNMTPSKSTLDRLPKRAKETWEEDAARYNAALRDAMVVPEEARSVAVSLDGVLIPMKDAKGPETRQKAAESGKLTRGPAGYREASCATLTFCDAKGDLISAVRFAQMPEANKVTLKRRLLQELTVALEKRPDLEVVKLADGALDNWTFLDESVASTPNGASAVDFYHACEHLGAAVALVHGEGTVVTRRRFAALRHVLLEEENGVESVIRALRYMHDKESGAKKREALKRELSFFRKRRSKMQYATMKRDGLAIGSGVVEAACKTLVAQRMKLSGMQWGMEGGQAILNIRGWTQSNRFDQAWQMLAAACRARVTVLSNIVMLRPNRGPRTPELASG